MKERITDFFWQVAIVAVFVAIALLPATFVYCFVKVCWLTLKWIASQPW